MGIDRRSIHRDQFLGALKPSPQLMGILNVTPDSFSDGGRHFDAAAAVVRAKAMIAEGAAIVDVGGELTRPGHSPVSQDEELRRVVPVLEALAAASLDAPISIDTGKAAVARDAARLGACVINDIWGLQRDSSMADAVAETGSAIVVMHNREEKDPAIDILDDVERFFERSLNIAAGAGVAFRPNSARSGRWFRQDAAAEPCLHLESRSLPTVWGADPGRALPQVVHRRDH